MKLTMSLVLTATAALALGAVRADDKPDQPAAGPATIALAIKTTVTGAPAKNQEPQFMIADTLAHFGFNVDSQVATAWDTNLGQSKPGKVTTHAVDKKPDAPAGADKPAAKPCPFCGEDRPADSDSCPRCGMRGWSTTAGGTAPAFTIAGTIDLTYKPTLFEGKPVTDNYVAKVVVSVRDGSGTELKKVTFRHYFGRNMNATGLREQTSNMTQEACAYFIMDDVAKIDGIASVVPQALQKEWAEFVKAMDDNKRDHFDDAGKHGIPDQPAPQAPDQGGK